VFLLNYATRTGLVDAAQLIATSRLFEHEDLSKDKNRTILVAEEYNPVMCTSVQHVPLKF
jgi:hypothetical protein